MHAQHNPGGRDGRGQQGGAAAGEATRTRGRIPGVRCATCRSENRDTFNFCSHRGAQPYRGPSVPRDPHAPPVEMDAEKLQARRASILARLEGRPGQRRKGKIDRVNNVTVRSQMISTRSFWHTWTGTAGGKPRRITTCLTDAATWTRKAEGRRGFTTRRVQRWGPRGGRRVRPLAGARSNTQPGRSTKALYRSCGWPTRKCWARERNGTQ